jgi:hypothetical protein
VIMPLTPQKIGIVSSPVGTTGDENGPVFGRTL